jgi:hypothetical protein
MSNFDTDINSYSFNELKTLLNINLNVEFTNELLEKNYSNKINQLRNLDDTSLAGDLNIFFTKIYNLLYLHKKSENYTKKFSDNLNNEELINKIDKLESNVTNIIENKIHNVNTVNESNIPINPKTYNTIKKQVAINSEFKSPASQLSVPTNCGITGNPNKICDKISQSTNFIIDLPESINNVISLELVNSDIPNIIYTFSEKKGNNKFIVCINSNDLTDDIEYDITIPDGVWFVTDIENFISSFYFDVAYVNDATKNKYLRYLKFEVSESSARPVFRFKTLEEIDTFLNIYPWANISYDDMSSLNLAFSIRNIYTPSICVNNDKPYHQHNMDELNFSLSCLGTLGYTLSDIYNRENSIYKLIAFNDTNYITTIGIYTYYGFLESRNIYGHTNDSGLYISVNDFVGNQSQQLILLGFGETITSDNILARIPTAGTPFGNNHSNSKTIYTIKRTYHGGVRIRKLHIQVLDTYGRIVDLQNYPTNFVFEFTCEYSNEKLSAYRNKLFNKQ